MCFLRNFPAQRNPSTQEEGNGAPTQHQALDGEEGGHGLVRADCFPQWGEVGRPGLGVCATHGLAGQSGDVCYATRRACPQLSVSLVPWGPGPTNPCPEMTAAAHSASSIVSPKIHIPPEPHNVILLAMGSLQMSLVKGTQRHWEEGHMTIEAEIGRIKPQAEEQMPGTSRGWRGKKGSSSRAFKKHTTL